MKFFVHEATDGDTRIYDSPEEWRAIVKEKKDFPEGFQLLILLMFRRGQDRYYSQSYGDFYVVDIPPFYWDGSLKA